MKTHINYQYKFKGEFGVFSGILIIDGDHYNDGNYCRKQVMDYLEKEYEDYCIYDDI